MGSFVFVLIFLIGDFVFLSSPLLAPICNRCAILKECDYRFAYRLGHQRGKNAGWICCNLNFINKSVSLLDSNICIHFLRGQYGLIDKLKAVELKNCAIS